MADSRSSRTAVEEGGFAELRTLLVGPEQRELLELQEHFRDPAMQTHDVSRVLPDAIALRAGDPQLSRVLAPLVADSITSSVRKDPQPLADALFPVIGPAIRKAIGHTLAAMMESFNRTIEQRLSWRAVQWRWIAWKTGRPFAEIVLLHTLQYRVEQVFLIHAETGLLLQHVGRERGTADGDQISAMLTAIQDFVRDSFRVAASDSLEALRVGDLSIFVERGPQAVVAGVVRGTAPPGIRQVFEEAVEAVHRQLGNELRAFRGDATPCERAIPILENCLVAEFRTPQRPQSYWRWRIAAAAILLALGAWAFFTMRDRQRWNAYVERLGHEPGVVVLSSGRQDGRFFVAGLRDPLAADPRLLLSSFALGEDRVASRWEPYETLHAPFVVERAQDLLRPPPGVTLEFRDGLLTARGNAPARWVSDSERLAPALAGVRRFRYDGVDPETALTTRLESLSARFLKGTASFAPGQADALRTIGEVLAELNETARGRGKRIRLEVRGHTDADGSDRLNVGLSETRARTLLGALATDRFDRLDFSVRGVASSEPSTLGANEQDKQQNRRVSFRVLPSGPDEAR